ncbi:MAG: hypothetical protein FJ123_16295 [Deltaproteobacteria bacterium]|nr:hypothetical protein [Deltaproteobacteria bacterium]
MYADKGFIGHTNNYVSLKMKLNGVEVKGASQTFIRLGRINRLLRDSAGMVDLIRIKEFLSDHVNYPYAICRHTQKEEERSHMPDFADFLGDNSKTIASFIFAIQEQKAYVAKGNPCVGSYTEYKL